MAAQRFAIEKAHRRPSLGPPPSPASLRKAVRKNELHPSLASVRSRGRTCDPGDRALAHATPPRRFPLSTLRFVREAVQQRKARHRLRDILILAARTAAILLLALAMARPLWSDRPIVDANSLGDTARVVLVDTSQSMAAVSQGTAAYERARAKAADYLVFRSGLHVNLLLAGAEPISLFDGLSTNFQAMHDELDHSGPRPERLNLAAALSRAGEFLAGTASTMRRELVIVSDFQRNSWATADFTAVPADTRIELESVAPAETPSNAAVLKVSTPEQVVQGRPGRLEVEVGNYSPASRKLSVQVEFDGDSDSATYRLMGVCEANKTLTISQDVMFARPGWRAAAHGCSTTTTRCRPTTFAALLWKCARRRATHWSAAKRRRAATRLAFISNERLAPLAARQAESHHADEGTLLARFDPTQIDDQSVAASDLIVLDHPGKLSDSALRRLWGLLERGRGILYFAAEAVDALNLKQFVTDSGGGLQLPVEFMPASASRPRHDLFLSDVRRNESAVFDFRRYVAESHRAVAILRRTRQPASRCGAARRIVGQLQRPFGRAGAEPNVRRFDGRVQCRFARLEPDRLRRVRADAFGIGRSPDKPQRPANAAI